MLIDNNLLEQTLGVSSKRPIRFENLGLLDSQLPNVLSFVETDRFLAALARNRNIRGVFVTPELVGSISTKTVEPIVCDDPRYYFYKLYNFRAQEVYQKTPSAIDPSASIAPSAHVAEYNVRIGRNAMIEPGAIVLPDVEIGDDCFVGAGSVLGCDDAEIKRTSRGIFRIIHDGKLRIGSRVEIGAHCTLDKGFSHQDTVIGDDTKLANRTYIGHSVQIGRRCMLLCCTVLGSAVVEDDVRINPGAIIKDHTTIGQKATVTLGSVVVESVRSGRTVSGNFAVDHNRFLYFMAKNFKP